MIRSCYRLGLSSLLLVLAALPAAAQDRWEKDIAAFEAADQVTPPPKGEILFVGSSTIRLWDLKASFPDLKTINRGFGGSEMQDTTRYVDRIVVPYSPRIVVVYAGDNDIMGTPSEQIVIWLMHGHAEWWQVFILATLLAGSLAFLSWHLIEKRALRLKPRKAWQERGHRIMPSAWPVKSLSAATSPSNTGGPSA